MSTLSENMRLAKRAIKYVDSLDITSINVPFRITSYYKSPLSDFDMFMLLYMRQESSTDAGIVEQHAKKELQYYKGPLTEKDKKEIIAIESPGVLAKLSGAKEVKKQIMAILRGGGGSSAKKKKLKELMEKSKFDKNTFDFTWFTTRTDADDENRIRTVRKAIKYRHGNCGEKSAVATTWLLEQTQNTKKIFWVAAENWDHAWGLMGSLGTFSWAMVTGRKYDDWPEDVVVIDGWTSDWYPIKHPYNPVKGTAANPFQLYVRKKVQQAEKAIRVQEELDWPPEFAPKFRLAVAEKKNATYANSVRFAEVFDDPSLVDESEAD
jgi:hypothetical protein